MSQQVCSTLVTMRCSQEVPVRHERHVVPATALPGNVWGLAEHQPYVLGPCHGESHVSSAKLSQVESYLCARGAGVLQDAIIIEGEALGESVWEELDAVVLHEALELGPADAGVLSQGPNQGLQSLVVHREAIVGLGLSCLQELQAQHCRMDIEDSRCWPSKR